MPKRPCVTIKGRWYKKMKAIVTLTLLAALTGCVGDAVRGVANGAADVGTGAVDVVTAPIP